MFAVARQVVMPRGGLRPRALGLATNDTQQGVAERAPFSNAVATGRVMPMERMRPRALGLSANDAQTYLAERAHLQKANAPQ
jgi:hypothetical protein